MQSIIIKDGFDDFRKQARDLLLAKTHPKNVAICDGVNEGSFLPNWEHSQLGFETTDSSLGGKPVATSEKAFVPKEFVALASDVGYHSSPEKWNLLYRLLWRLTHGESNLLDLEVDDDVRSAKIMRSAVRREVHKVHAFVRFEKAVNDEKERYIAWLTTDHPMLELAAPFFVRRFGDKPWSILTPLASAHWDGMVLTMSEGVKVAPRRAESMDELWKSYYRSIFNPARVKIKAMKAEMPERYWQALPESDVINDLIRESPERLTKMAQNHNAQAIVPETVDWNEVRTSASLCQACPIGEHATQTVFGEGNLSAKIMIIGEQPGDTEDIEGRAFVGPAGEVLNDALQSAGISRKELYITNAVKHFKWKPSSNGKVRIHQKPSGAEMHACKPWLEIEIELVRPEVIVCMGQTAATAIFGRLMKISEELGKVHTNSPYAPHVLVTYHPSAILRSISPGESERMKRNLIEALKVAQNLETELRNYAIS